MRRKIFYSKITFMDFVRKTGIRYYALAQLFDRVERSTDRIDYRTPFFAYSLASEYEGLTD